MKSSKEEWHKMNLREPDDKSLVGHGREVQIFVEMQQK